MDAFLSSWVMALCVNGHLIKTHSRRCCWGCGDLWIAMQMVTLTFFVSWSFRILLCRHVRMMAGHWGVTLTTCVWERISAISERKEGLWKDLVGWVVWIWEISVMGLSSLCPTAQKKLPNCGKLVSVCQEIHAIRRVFVCPNTWTAVA